MTKPQWASVSGLVFVMLGLLIATAVIDQTQTADTRVVYVVDGTQASLTYATPSGTAQADDIALPITLRYPSFAHGHPYLSAQNEGTGQVTCHIRVNGKEISANTAYGQYAIATCDGTA